MKKVFIVGAGQMGLDIGQVMAKTGYEVVFNDMSQEILDNAVAKLEKALDKMVSKGKMAEDQKAAIMGRISTSVDLAAAADADLIIEAIVENVDIKKAYLQNLMRSANLKQFLQQIHLQSPLQRLHLQQNVRIK